MWPLRIISPSMKCYWLSEPTRMSACNESSSLETSEKTFVSSVDIFALPFQDEHWQSRQCHSQQNKKCAGSFHLAQTLKINEERPSCTSTSSLPNTFVSSFSLLTGLKPNFSTALAVTNERLLPESNNTRTLLSFVTPPVTLARAVCKATSPPYPVLPIQAGTLALSASLFLGLAAQIRGLMLRSAMYVYMLACCCNQMNVALLLGIESI